MMKGPGKYITQVLWTCLLLGLFGHTIHAQNNAIFTGGVADGFTLACFLQPSGNLIFAGGPADGFVQNCFLQASNNTLFTGGNADGFSQDCFLQPSGNLIFAGGNADGFDQDCFVEPASNGVFAGGNADGFSIACFAMAAQNAIFAGGIADGFDQSCFLLPTGNDIFAGGNSDGFVEGCFLQQNSSLIFAGGIADGFSFNQTLISPVFAVELLSFDGVYDNGDAWLGWVTATEINNSHFELERSIDGVIFERIATVPGAGTSYDIQTYEYRDPIAHLAGSHDILYYRLMQVDFDGTFDYSNIVSLKLEAVKNTVTAFPNPATKTLFLRFRSHVNHLIWVELFDLQGRKIRNITFSPEPGLNLFQFDVSDLPEGVYYCRVEFGETVDEISIFKILVLP